MTGLSDGRLRQLLAWLVIVLLAVPVGGALWLGVAHGESPCILCWAQRTSMILMALVALFVVRYGPRPRYLGMLVLLAGWGTFMAIRHSSLHLARDIGQGFAASILGAHTYTWAWVVHWAVLLVAGAILLVVRGPLAGRTDRSPGLAARSAMALFVVLAAANAVQAFVSTGPPPFLGQGDPVRMSLDPSRWVWTTPDLSTPSWRGSWSVPEPDPAAVEVDPDPANGPLTGLPTLPVSRWERIAATVEGRLTGFAAAPASPAAPSVTSGRAAAVPFLAVTDDYAVYLLDPSPSGATTRRVVLDPGYSIDLSSLAGAAFLGPDTVAVMATNKSYVLLRPDSSADPDVEWRHFLESSGDVRELRRSRFSTVRARQMYALSLAYDPAADELITVTVPSPHHRKLVVSRFDRRDFVLSSEFRPDLGPGLALSGADRGLGDYVVTGATVADGLLWAYSAAYSTLLAIDLDARRVAAGYAVPGITAPVGLAARGDELLIAQGDGRVAVVERPTP